MENIFYKICDFSNCDIFVCSKIIQTTLIIVVACVYSSKHWVNVII